MSDTLELRVGCEFRYRAEHPTPSVFQVEPHGAGQHRVLRDAWELVPEAPSRAYRDLYDNVCRRMTIPAGEFSLRYDATVQVPDAFDATAPEARELPAQDLPDDVLLYTLPSRYCLSDELADDAWERFGAVAPGYGRVQAITDFVHGHVRFQYGSSTPSTTAVDVHRDGVGVCRDFAHLGITYCRALNIPARYVFGYLPDIAVEPLPDPMDFCAWAEAWLDGRWYTFDPRNNEPRKGRTVIGRGRDALDVAMVTTYGAPSLEAMTVWAEEAPAGVEA